MTILKARILIVLFVIDIVVVVFFWGEHMNVQFYLEQSQADEIMEISKKFEDDLKVYEIPVWQPHHKATKSYGIVPSDGDDRFGPMTHNIQLKGLSSEEEIKTLTFIHKISRHCICRLDYGKHVAPHNNPDSTIIHGPHLHIYKEGLDDDYAIPLSDVFPKFKGDTVELIKLFLEYCHISYDGVDFQGDLYG